jgi:hypothetical protein
MGEIVNVGPADADGAYPHDHLPRSKYWLEAVFEPHVVNAIEHRSPH